MHVFVVDSLGEDKKYQLKICEGEDIYSCIDNVVEINGILCSSTSHTLLEKLPSDPINLAIKTSDDYSC